MESRKLKWLKHLFINSGLVVGPVLLSVVCLKLIDSLFFSEGVVFFGTDFRRLDQTAVTHKEIYPYSDGHTQPDFIARPGFSTGDHGFMVDFDLDRPPRKSANEFRLILTGGSGAVGWGASSPDTMMSNVIERLFPEMATCGAEVTLRVINLAMGGSKSYQNYIALNRWGQAL